MKTVKYEDNSCAPQRRKNGRAQIAKVRPSAGWGFDHSNRQRETWAQAAFSDALIQTLVRAMPRMRGGAGQLSHDLFHACGSLPSCPVTGR